MKRQDVLEYEFVSAIPEKLEERTLYVSMNYATVAHKCCCGCGREVATPLSPTDWKLIFDGISISLSPSIGNWSFECKSHYWIKNSTIRWAEQWSKERIAAGRVYDRIGKGRRYGDLRDDLQDDLRPTRNKPRKSVFSWFAALWSR